MSATVTIFRAELSTNCERVALALAHKGIAADSILIDYSDRSPVEQVSGQGLVPVIVDGDAVVNDSVAIMRHLDRVQPEPPLFPPRGPARAEVDVFIDWFERVWKRAPNAIESELERERPDRARIAALGAEIEGRLEIFEQLLDGRDFLFGTFGAADCVAYPFLKYAGGREAGDDELFHRILDDYIELDRRHSALREWLARVNALPRAFPSTG